METPVTITGKHIEITEPLRQYVTEKIGRACRLLDKIGAAHVTITVEKYRHIVEVVIQSHGTTIRGKEETHDMYSSIDAVMDKVEGQVKRLKERIKHHRRGEEAGEESAAPEEVAADHPRVFEMDRFAAKPLTVDEAVAELQGLEDVFLAFQNAKTGQVNVLYKRGDGTFGLVRPHS